MKALGFNHLKVHSFQSSGFSDVSLHPYNVVVEGDSYDEESDECEETTRRTAGARAVELLVGMRNRLL